MQEASFTGFIKTLFYLVVFYYVFKFLFRLFAPIVLRNIVQKAEANFKQNQQQHYTSNNQNTTTQAPSFSRPKETKKVGEYVDYEEID